MFRTGASRTILRSFNAAAQPTFRANVNARLQTTITSQLCTLARRPQTAAAVKPLALHFARGAASKDGPPMDKIDTKHEKELAKHVLEADPERVSMDSSVHPVFGEVAAPAEKKEEDKMMAGVNQDIQTIKDTFDMSEVPKPALYIGLAGVLPYVATSLSTVFCAYEIHAAHESGSGLILSEKTAELMLHVLEPLQIGYGATIISFLGAIHWGLEWAKFGGEAGWSRYSIGVIGTALAWPTILLPVEYALISQFLIFNYMYYKDSRACRAGWAPAWYGVYRFALTFIVGAAIVLSLIGRGQVSDRIGRLPGPADRVKQLRDHQAAEAENEEEQRRKFLASKDEEDDE
ncbi:hypothetical protein CKM354_000888800 [Cercospora kikuchii]|uniref:Mitochondrial inner membrane protein 1 n=1 Tax=Cercospora kikuchii TaxID=84275 RepID=A0A9P3FJP1_9PEZI|nr:uncharacterized protein CKM354_000888800 [Cercospora kikuchii]GIZ45734.1 hypothetical protein CKM354_000888800 [Cercospora kikuchii]